MEEDLNNDLFSCLRGIENDAYRSVVDAFRSQGELTVEKQEVLSQLQEVLHISDNDHTNMLLHTENDPLIQRIVKNNINDYRVSIEKGHLSSVNPLLPPPPVKPISNILPPPPKTMTRKKKKRLFPSPTTKKRKKKSGGFAVVPSPPPKRRKRKRVSDPITQQEIQNVQPQRKVRKVSERQKKSAQPQLPPPAIPLPPPTEVFPFAVDLTKLSSLGDVQKYVDDKNKVIDDIEGEWKDEKPLKDREILMSKIRSERFMLMQVLKHVDYTL